MPGTVPRRLLLLINALDADGGAEAQLTYLSQGLAARGHQVTLCCIDRSAVATEPFESLGIEVLQLGIEGRARRALAVPRQARLARRAEIVHCTMWDASLWGRLAAVLARRPVLVADHATDRSVQVAASGNPRAGWIATHNRLLDPFTYATVACAGSQRPVLEAEGVAAEKIVYIPNGVPAAALREQARSGGGRAALGLPAEGPILMQVGVFRPEKNQAGALAALPAVLEAFPAANLVFVGHGEEQAKIEAEAAGMPPGRVHFLGLRDDVPALLGEADLMLLPSRSDAMPMVVLEAMAVGTPCVATAVGDVPSLLAPGGGLCVAVGDPDALAAACVELLGDPERREAMGAAAISSVERYDSERMVERYEELFAAACEGRPPLLAAPPVAPAAVA